MTTMIVKNAEALNKILDELKKFFEDSEMVAISPDIIEMAFIKSKNYFKTINIFAHDTFPNKALPKGFGKVISFWFPDKPLIKKGETNDNKSSKYENS